MQPSLLLISASYEANVNFHFKLAGIDYLHFCINALFFNFFQVTGSGKTLAFIIPIIEILTKR